MVSETLIPLADAAELLPVRPSLSTLSRWRREGFRGVKLETVVVGRRRCTSLEALERFIAATTERADQAARRAAR
jgi:hypothetical protein